MAVAESNDKELRRVIFERDKVIVKFTDEGCPVCKELDPKFRKLSLEPSFQDVTFLLLNAKENPVSSREVQMTGSPFFATYRHGTLLDCGIVATEQDLRQMLHQLL